MAEDTTPLLAIVGPTASGKSEAGVIAAHRLNAEILAVDSMSVYRDMDVGTAKPSAEQRALVRHHLLDVASIDEPFSVARYQELAREALAAIAGGEHRALLVGGTGLYFRAVVDELSFPGTDATTRGALEEEAERLGPDAMYRRLEELDPAAAAKIEPSNVRRTVRALEVASVTGRPFSSYAVEWETRPREGVRAAGIRMAPEVLRERIERRVRAQLRGGFVEEVEHLARRGLAPSITASQAIGYAEVVRHLAGAMSLEEVVERTVKRTRALARRQMAWFRRDPRIRWFDAGARGAIEIVDELTEYLAGGSQQDG